MVFETNSYAFEEGIMANGTNHPGVFDELLRPSHTGVPKYMRLSDVLLNAIKTGYWKAGDKLPNEEELTELTPFSLGTVQRALRNLADQGILIRQHGLGSFVAESDLRLEDPWHCRFIGDDGQSILPVYSRVIRRELVTEKGHWSEYFQQAEGHVMRIDRVINVNNEFNVFTRFFADRRMLTELWEAPVKKLNGLNFKALIAQQRNFPITHIGHCMRAASFDEEVSAALKIDGDTVGILMHAIARMGRDACVYYQEFSIPPTSRLLTIPEQSLGGSNTKTRRTLG